MFHSRPQVADYIFMINLVRYVNGFPINVFRKCTLASHLIVSGPHGNYFSIRECNNFRDFARKDPPTPFINFDQKFHLPHLFHPPRLLYFVTKPTHPNYFKHPLLLGTREHAINLFIYVTITRKTMMSSTEQYINDRYPIDIS